MNAVWKEQALERPDPYLDWEFRTRRKAQDDLFCSVQVQVIAVLENGKWHYLPNLYRLRDAVVAGRQDDDDGISTEPVTIRMSGEEFVHLKETIKRIEHDGDVFDKIDKIEVQFFIYRRESVIYHAGDYRNPAFYEVILVGPPIKGLTFHESSDLQRLNFGKPLVTAGVTVAIGIIDDGIGFAHQRFRSGSQSTRIEGLWLQELERPLQPDNRVAFGTQLNKKDIDNYLATGMTDAGIYRKVGTVDFGCREYNPLAARAAHGTHVLDLATGSDGTLKDRPIFAVQLPSVATIDTSGVTMGSYVLQAVRQIMLWADGYGDHGVPLVLNFSYGLLAGPKDGTQPLEQALSDLIHYRNKKKHLRTRLVMPAGNSYRTRAAARMELKPSHRNNVDWMVSPDDETANFVEIWLDGKAGKRSPVEVTFTLPQQHSGHTFRPEAGKMYALMADGSPIAGLYYHVFNRGKKKTRERIMLAINPTVRNEDHRDLAPSGRWNVSIKNKMKDAITAHLYVQRDDTPFGYPPRGRQSRLDREDAYARDKDTGDYREPAKGCPITHKETLSSIATCSPIPPDHTIVVGGAEASEHYPPADYTASGPTILRLGPDCSAIADDGRALRGVLGAGTLTGTVVAMNGTSVAVPQVTREVANGLEMNTNKPTGKIVRGKPKISAVSASGRTTIQVPALDQARLGKFLLLPEDNAETPKRRYPANP